MKPGEAMAACQTNSADRVSESPARGCRTRHHNNTAPLALPRPLGALGQRTERRIFDALSQGPPY